MFGLQDVLLEKELDELKKLHDEGHLTYDKMIEKARIMFARDDNFRAQILGKLRGALDKYFNMPWMF